MATTLQLLKEAKAAYHNLMLGTSARVVVDQNQERVEYTSANAPRLAAYIVQLQALYDSETGAVKVSGPAGVIF